MSAILKLRLLRCVVLVTALSLTFPLAAVSFDACSQPVTDELLRGLGLDREYHQCIHVADGDTLTLDRLGVVRFVGVDTPEKNHPMLPLQFMAKESSAFTKRLCMNRQIRLDYDPCDDDKRGKYGRVLGYLYLRDGTFVQEELLKQGYAIAYTKYPLDEKKKDRFLSLEREAQDRGVNLWRDGGMPEIRWIIDQKQALMEVERASPSSWRLRFGGWASEPTPTEEIEERLGALYSSIYSLCPRDLREKLKQLGFHQGRPRAPTGETVTVIGMAHKKWGLIYEGLTHPRTTTETLGAYLRNVSQWMDVSGSPEMKTVLLKNGFRPLPEMAAASPHVKEIADAFLTS